VARNNDVEPHIFSNNLLRSKREALEVLDARGLDGMQALTLASLWYKTYSLRETTSTELLRVRVREGAVTFGTVNAHDGHQYPDYNQLCIHTMGSSGSSYNNSLVHYTNVAYVMNMRNTFALARLEPASGGTRRVAQNSDWYVDAVYKTSYAGAAVELRAPDVLAIGAGSLVVPDLPSVEPTADLYTYMSTAMLASAKVVTGNNPAIHEAFMGAEGAGTLKYLTQLNADDPALSAAFMQLNYDITLTEKGSRKAAAKTSAVEMLRRPDVTDELDQDKVGFSDAEKMFALLGRSRVPLDIKTSGTPEAIVRELSNLSAYMPGYIADTVTNNADTLKAKADDGLYQRASMIKQYESESTLKRMANTFNGIWN